MVAYLDMFPVISLGPFSISSYGIFLAAGFLFGVFLVWRLSRAWDLPEEKVLDLTLLTFLGGLLGARILFIWQNFEYFGWDIIKWLSIHRIGGFSLWGALIGGFFTLKYTSKKFKLNFWQVLDFASIGVLGGLIFQSLGCFLGGCNIGVTSNFFAFQMVGEVGKRMPVQIFEAILYSFAIRSIWGLATHFHIPGTVAAVSLVCVGVIRIILKPLKADQQNLFLDVILLILGIILYYKLTKRNIIADAKNLANPKLVLPHLKRIWYNYKVNFNWKIRVLLKFLRRINVYFSHKNSKYY